MAENRLLETTTNGAIAAMRSCKGIFLAIWSVKSSLSVAVSAGWENKGFLVGWGQSAFAPACLKQRCNRAWRTARVPGYSMRVSYLLV